MSDPKEIWLQPECCADPSDGRLWCEQDAPEDCEDGKPWARYVLAAQVERLTQSLLIERGKLERADEENERLQKIVLVETDRVQAAWKAQWVAEARLAEKDETIDRMQGLLETCDKSMDELRARLAEYAAEVEWLRDG